MPQRWLSVLCLGIALCLAAAKNSVADGAAVPMAAAPMALDIPGAQTCDPFLGSDGASAIGCAWISRTNDRSRVLFREKQGDAWQDPVPFSGTPGVIAASPIVAYDPLSQPHLIWRETDLSGVNRIYHASRQSNFWIFHGPIAIAQTAKIADPTADFDSQGMLHIAWREGAGSYWSIRCATVETSGTTTLRTLTEGEAPRQHFFPTVAGKPGATVSWFTQDAGQLRLQMRQFDPARRLWVPVPNPDLSGVPINRLPFLFESAAGATCGLWVDAFKGMERIFWGISGAETHGAGVLVDETETVPGSQPCGVWSDQGPLVVWRGQIESGAAILARRHGVDGWTPAAQIPAPYATQPRITALPNSACVAWVSDSSDGGDGNIYASALQFADK